MASPRGHGALLPVHHVGSEEAHGLEEMGGPSWQLEGLLIAIETLDPG